MATKPRVRKLPTQLYVTARKGHQSWDAERNKLSEFGPPIGFLHPHEPNVKGDDKRKETQDFWAYGGTPKLVDGTWLKSETFWIPNPEYRDDIPWQNQPCGRQLRQYRNIPIDYPPMIWDNVPMEGFRITDFVARYRGNKLWAILDPRGYEFEITTACLNDLIQAVGISKGGLIPAPCRWKSNKYLVPVLE